MEHSKNWELMVQDVVDEIHIEHDEAEKFLGEILRRPPFMVTASIKNLRHTINEKSTPGFDILRKDIAGEIEILSNQEVQEVLETIED